MNWKTARQWVRRWLLSAEHYEWLAVLALLGSLIALWAAVPLHALHLLGMSVFFAVSSVRQAVVDARSPVIFVNATKQDEPTRHGPPQIY